MKPQRLVSSLAILFALASGLYGQGTPDCQFTSTFSAQAPGNAQSNKGVYCVAWRLAYYTANATGVSIQLEGTDDIAGAPDAGGWTALTAVPSTGSPATGTPNGQAAYCCDYYPWIRVNPGTFAFNPGGLLTARSYGYKGTSAANGIGGALHAADGDTSVQFNTGGFLNGDNTKLQYISGTPTPAAPTVTTHGATGSTVYGYQVAFVFPTGPSTASPETQIATGNAALDGTNYNIIQTHNEAGAIAPCTTPNEQVAISLTTANPLLWDTGLLAVVPCGTAFHHTGQQGDFTTPITIDETQGLVSRAIGAVRMAVGNAMPANSLSNNVQPLGAALFVSTATTGDQNSNYRGQFTYISNSNAGGAVTPEVDGAEIHAAQYFGTAGYVVGIYGAASVGYDFATPVDVTGVIGLEFAANQFNPGTVGSMKAARLEVSSFGGTTGTVYGLDISALNASGGTIDNTIGLNIASVSSGGVSNKAIQTGLGSVNFGDTTSAPRILGNTGTPGIAGCSAAFTAASASNDLNGRITSGTTGPCAITLTFTAAYPTIPAVLAQDETTGVFLGVTPATGGVILTGVTNSGDIIAYHVL